MAANNMISSQLVYALDKVSDAVVVIGPDDSVVYINDPFLELFPGNTKNDLLKNSIASLITFITAGLERKNSFSADAMERYIQQQLSDASEMNVEFESDSGRHLRYRDSITPDGFRVGIFSDESPIVALHNQFENACEEAEKLSNAKNSFMAAMSHEVKTPLNAIIGMLDLCVLDDYIANNEYIKRIQKNADNLLSLINNVLDFAKFDANKVVLSPTPTNLRVLCEDIIEGFSGSADLTHTELILMLDPQIPETIALDDIRITQVINNLISNGLKFNRSEHPKLSVNVLYDIENNKVQCAIKDNGIGISSEQQKYIFGDFEQASTETHRQFGGSGLGLSICQRISWLMGGSLDVQSEEGNGATFVFSFPLPQGTQPRGLETYENSEELKHMELLTDSPTFFKALNAYKRFFAFKTKFCKTFPKELLSNQLAFLLEKNEQTQSLLTNIDYDGQIFCLDNKEQSNASENVPNYSLTPLKLTDLFAAVKSHLNKEPVFIEESSPLGGSNVSDNAMLLPTGTTALIVEDNQDNMFVLQRQFQKLKIQADFALDPIDALEYFENKEYHLVLSDYQMPNMNGAQLVTEMRKVEKEENRTACPMFIVTADKTQQCLDRCQQASATSVIMKPLTLSSIKALMDDVFSNVTRTEAKDLSNDSIEEEGVSIPSSKYDLAVLADILGDPSDDDLNAFLMQYIDNFASAKTELESAANAEQWQELGALSHAMKSSALIIGANELSQACEALEKHCQLSIEEKQAEKLWQNVHRELELLGEELSNTYSSEVSD